MSNPRSERASPKRSVIVGTHKTSIALEDLFWDQIVADAKDQDITVNALITQIAADPHRASGNLSSCVRLYLYSKALALIPPRPEASNTLNGPEPAPASTVP